MDSDLDPFADVFPEPAVTNARAGGKFLPRAKPRPRKGTTASIPSTIPSNTKENANTAQPAQLVNIADNGLKNPAGSSLATSTTLVTEERMTNNEDSLGVADDNVKSKLGNPSAHGFGDREDDCRDSHSSIGRSTGENTDIFSGLECFDDFLTQSACGIVSASSKSHGKVNMDGQPANKFLASYSVNNDVKDFLSPSEMPTLLASNNKDLEGISGIPTQSSVDFSASRVCDAAQAHARLHYCTTQDPVPCREAAVSNNNGGIQIDHGRLETEFQEAGVFPDLETLDVMSEATIASGRRTRKFQPKPKVQTGKEKTSSSISHPDAVDCVSCPPNAQFVPSETQFTDEGPVLGFPPDGVLDYSINWCSDEGNLIPPDSIASELPVHEEVTNLAEIPHSDAAISGDHAHSEDVSGMPEKLSSKGRQRKTSTVSDLSRKSKKYSAAGDEFEGGSGRSLRQPRKQVAAGELVDEPEDEACDNGGFAAEPPSSSIASEDKDSGDEYRVESTSVKKKDPRKSKKPVAENKKPVRKRKSTNNEADQSTKEPPKKFSHSTRRNKRCVDKTFLETPEDEIDFQRVRIKDLILLAEYKERLASKEAKTSRTPSTNQRTENSFHEEESQDGEETFASELGGGTTGDQASCRAQSSSLCLNYQSYMKKTPSARWSKQDTELFYEAIQQFGTDLSMIQQLFPGRTRNQVKLKYKKEERQHPLRLSEAVTNRAKDHSHFEKVIEQLQRAAAQAEHDSNGDDSIGVTGEDEVEELISENNEEAAKPKHEEDEAAEDWEDDNPDGVDDDIDDWNSYKSEF